MELIVSILTGSILGLLTGLGIGGGSLLILYLTVFKGMEPAQARGISLLFFFPAAVLSAARNHRKIPVRQILPAIIGGTLSAVLFSLLAGKTNPVYFKKGLGLLFLFLGGRELFYKPKKA